MVSKKYTAEYTINKLREAEILLNQVKIVAAVTRKIGVSSVDQAKENKKAAVYGRLFADYSE